MARLDGAGVRVVLVGTGTHAPGSTLPDVPQVEPTVRAVRRSLIDACGVRPDNLVTLLDPATPEEFLRAVSDAACDATDVLLLHYVGHGVVSAASKLHLATRAAVDLERMPAYQALPYEHIVEELTNSRARAVVVVLDCCYSARAPIPVASGALLASADRDEQALAVAGEELTAFSGELVRVLGDGIPTAPAELNLQLVHDHLSRTMATRGRPQPRLAVGNQAGQLILAPNRAYRTQPVAPDQGVRPWDGACPYRGLDPFTAADADVFHGRGALVEHLMIQLGQRTRTGGITVVTGPSGSGKSSLLAAGVLPGIAHGDLAVQGSAGWPAILLTPGDDPLSTLAERLSEHTPGADAEGIRRRLVEHPDRAHAVFAEAAGSAGRMVLVVDQVEELFAGTVSDADRRAVVRALHSAAEPDTDRGPAALVVLGLRSDFHGSFARFPELVGALQQHQVVVGPMTTAELRAAIIEPAEHAGLVLQPGLADQLLTDTGADPSDEHSAAYDPGALPLLSHALLATWQHRHGNQLTLEGYRKAGGVKGAITMTAEHTYASLDAAEQRVAVSLLPRMVNVGEGTPQDTRRSLRREQPEDPATTAVLEAFARARLVTLDGDRTNLTHEALIREWSSLRGWINADRDDRRAVQKLESDANDWADSGDDSLLYRGARLDEIDPHRPDLSGRARTFLAGARRHQRRARRIRLIAVGAVCVLALVASGAAVVAVRQADVARHERDNAIATQVATQADQLRDTDLSLAAQLDLTAYRMRPEDPARDTALIAASTTPLSTVLAGHAADVNAVAISPDGRTLATTSSDQTVRLWDMTNPGNPTPHGEPFHDHAHEVHGAAFSPDGRTLATTGFDETVRLWDVTDPARPTQRGESLTGLADPLSPEVFGAVAFSPDGRTLGAACGCGTVRLWDTTDPDRPTPRAHALPGHPGGTFDLTFSPDGHTLATACGCGTVQLWDATDPDNPTPRGQTHEGHTDAVNAVAFGPDGRTLATASSDRTVRLWDVTDPDGPRQVGQTPGGHTHDVFDVTFSPDGHSLATAGYDRTVRLWNVTDLAVPTPLGPPLTGHTDAVYAATFSPDGRTLATAGLDRTVRLWDVPDTILTGHTHSVNSVAFSPDGRTLATAGYDNTARLWTRTDPASPSELLAVHTGIVNVVAFGPGGHILVTASWDGTAQLWNTSDPTSPTPLGPLLTDRNQNRLYAAAFSPDGRTLALGGTDQRVVLLDISDPANPKPRSEGVGYQPQGVNAVAFSPDGRTLAIAGWDRIAQLWNVVDPDHPTQHGPAVLDHNGPVYGVAFSPDGRTLATASDDLTARLWNTTDPDSATLFDVQVSEHTNSVNGVAFSPDGRTLATASYDHTVRLWDVTDPADLTPLGPPLADHTNEVNAVAFSPDGLTLATASDDRTVRLWQLDAERVAERICATTKNNLTPEKWRQYVSPDLPYNPPCG